MRNLLLASSAAVRVKKPLFETMMTVGTATFYGSQPSFGYRKPAVQYGMGNLENKLFKSEHEITIVNWHNYSKNGGFVILGDHRSVGVESIEIGNVIIPISSIEFSGSETTFWFSTIGFVLPTAGSVVPLKFH